jgi:FixJ family two-component response regulator
MQPDTPLIAVVDDERSVRRALVRLLLIEGYRAEGFGSAPEFLYTLSTREPACLVLDVQMPQMNGLQLQEVLRSLGGGPPVIIITAHDEVETQRRCLALGARYYFRKPIDVDRLLTAIDEVVGGSVTDSSSMS